MATIITNVRIVDGSGNPPIERGHVVVDGSKVSTVAPGDPGPIGASHRLIDAEGRTVIPGLIDCHVHLAGVHAVGSGSEPDYAMRVADDALRVAGAASRLVHHGIVAIRDLGYPHHGIFAVRSAVEQGVIWGPRLVLAGRAIAASGGHGAGISVAADGPDAVRRAVRLEIKAGADWIKVMVTGGTATPGERVSDVQLTLDEVRAAVEEAHRRGKKVAAHCSNLAGAVLALDAGVDSIEHGIELDETAVRRMADRGVALAPALRCTEIEGTAESGGPVPEFVRLRAASIYRRQFESFRLALAAGVRIVAASDAGPSYYPVGLESLAAELETMVRAGMAPLAALRAATSEAAQLLGWESEIGTIAPGRSADLVVTDGDPTRDIADVARPWLVLVRGRLVLDAASGLSPETAAETEASG